jgi:hypothetical protein
VYFIANFLHHRRVDRRSGPTGSAQLVSEGSSSRTRNILKTLENVKEQIFFAINQRHFVSE